MSRIYNIRLENYGYGNGVTSHISFVDFIGDKYDEITSAIDGGNMDSILHEIVNSFRGEDKRFIIGISGHGASGKTTFAHNLLKVLGHNNVNYINTDPYIIGSHLRKYTLINYEYKNEQHQEKMTACHPAAHHVFALERDIHMMRDGLDFYTIGTNYTKSMMVSSEN